MSIWRFITRGLVPIHILVGVALLIAGTLAYFGAMDGHPLLREENIRPRMLPIYEIVTDGLIAYAFFITGLVVAVRTKLHLYIRE